MATPVKKAATKADKKASAPRSRGTTSPVDDLEKHAQEVYKWQKEVVRWTKATQKEINRIAEKCCPRAMMMDYTDPVPAPPKWPKR